MPRPVLRDIAMTAVILIAIAGACAKPPPDEDATAAAARARALGAWHKDALDCDDREGDCADWSKLEIAKAGELRVEVLLTPSAGVPSLTLSLVDEANLTVLETRSDGRDQLGVKWDAEPGPLFLWLRPTNPGELRVDYRLRAELSPHQTLPPLPPRKTRSAGPPPSTRDACLLIEANAELNFYDGQPHAVLITLYPLRSEEGFSAAGVHDLLGGAMPPGVAGAKLRITITPGERRRVEEIVPRAVRSLGVVADFYREPNEPDGSRRVVVPVACGSGAPGVNLNRSDVRVTRR